MFDGIRLRQISIQRAFVRASASHIRPLLAIGEAPRFVFGPVIADNEVFLCSVSRCDSVAATTRTPQDLEAAAQLVDVIAQFTWQRKEVGRWLSRGCSLHVVGFIDSHGRWRLLAMVNGEKSSVLRFVVLK